MHRFDEFEPVRSMLKIAIDTHTISETKYIREIIEDAIAVHRNPDSIRTIRRTTYTYSVKLGRSNNPILNSNILEEGIKEEDVRALLKFFEAL